MCQVPWYVSIKQSTPLLSAFPHGSAAVSKFWLSNGARLAGLGGKNLTILFYLVNILTTCYSCMRGSWNLIYTCAKTRGGHPQEWCPNSEEASIQLRSTSHIQGFRLFLFFLYHLFLRLFLGTYGVTCIQRRNAVLCISSTNRKNTNLFKTILNK